MPAVLQTSSNQKQDSEREAVQAEKIMSSQQHSDDASMESCMCIWSDVAAAITMSWKRFRVRALHTLAHAHTHTLTVLCTLCCGPSGPHSSQGVMPALFSQPRLLLLRHPTRTLTQFNSSSVLNGAAAASCWTERGKKKDYLAFSPVHSGRLSPLRNGECAHFASFVFSQW